MAYDLLIKNGIVVDGSGSAGYQADVAVEGEKIAAIGKNLGPGKKEIDAKGHVVAPGFIDSHTHMTLSSSNIPTAIPSSTTASRPSLSATAAPPAPRCRRKRSRARCWSNIYGASWTST